MTETESTARQIALPATSRLNHIYATTDLADAYTIGLPLDATTDPETLARFLFAELPVWATNLMKVRDAAVAGFGLKTSRQLTATGPAAAAGRVGIFKIQETLPAEIVLGEDDKHLDFRLSVLYQHGQPGTTAADGAPCVVVSTVVHCHNLLGRSYIRLIEPFHRQIIKACLRRAARAGWAVA